MDVGREVGLRELAGGRAGAGRRQSSTRVAASTNAGWEGAPSAPPGRRTASPSTAASSSPLRLTSYDDMPGLATRWASSVCRPAVQGHRSLRGRRQRPELAPHAAPPRRPTLAVSISPSPSFARPAATSTDPPPPRRSPAGTMSARSSGAQRRPAEGSRTTCCPSARAACPAVARRRGQPAGGRRQVVSLLFSS